MKVIVILVLVATAVAGSDSFDPAEDSFDPAEDSFDPAEDSFDPAEDSLDPAEDSFESAEDSFESAEDSFDPAEDAVASERDLPVWRPFRPLTYTRTVTETSNVAHTVYATCLLADDSVPSCASDAEARHATMIDPTSTHIISSPTTTVMDDLLMPVLEPSTTQPPMESSGGRMLVRPIQVETETVTVLKTTATIIHSETVTVAIGGCVPPYFDIEAEVCSIPPTTTSDPATTDSPTTAEPPTTTEETP